MPFGGNDWHALTREPVLEPELPICDPHHHFWDRREERVPYHRYQLDELLADIGGHNVRSTVFIEARSMYRQDGPEELRPLGEVEYVQGIAAAAASGLYGPCRIAAAIIGHANLNLGERVEPVLQALEATSPSRFRGIRHTVTWDPNPEVDNTAAHRMPGQLLSEEFRAGARVLARMGLSFECWMYFGQLPELASFARAVPELTIVLNHVGGLNLVGPYANRRDEVMAQWRAGIAEVAACPNVHVKLGGLGMARTGFGWEARTRPAGSEEIAQSSAPIFEYCIEKFGPGRSMFESNFPVDKVSFSYNVYWNAAKRLSAGYPADERAAMLHDNAVKLYRIAEVHSGA